MDDPKFITFAMIAPSVATTIVVASVNSDRDTEIRELPVVAIVAKNASEDPGNYSTLYRYVVDRSNCSTYLEGYDFDLGEFEPSAEGEYVLEYPIHAHLVVKTSELPLSDQRTAELIEKAQRKAKGQKA